MRFQKQLFKHDPDNGVFGDCQRTVLACLLDLDPEEVPHVHRRQQLGEQFAMHEAFLRERGFARIEIPFAVEDLDQVLFTAAHYSGGLPYMLGGRSRLGTNHIVICQGKKIIWDPSQVGSGIVGPCDDGHFWVGWLFRPLTTAAPAEADAIERQEAGA